MHYLLTYCYEWRMMPRIKIQYLYIFFIAFLFDKRFTNVSQSFNALSILGHWINMKFYLTKVLFSVALPSDIHSSQLCGIYVGATLFNPLTKILCKVSATNQYKIQLNVISNILILLPHYKVKLIANKNICPTNKFFKARKSLDLSNGYVSIKIISSRIQCTRKLRNIYIFYLDNMYIKNNNIPYCILHWIV